MPKNSINQTCLRLQLLIFLTLIAFITYTYQVCDNEHYNTVVHKRDTIKSHEDQHYVRRHHRRRHQQISHGRRMPIIRKRCRYTEPDEALKEQLLDNNSDNYQQYNYVRHHQIREDQEMPYYLGDNIGETNNIDDVQTESLFVNIGQRINLTCHINTREIDWHFKDTNLTTTILSYGLQLQVRQSAIYKPNFKEHDFYSGVQENQLLKYELSSDLLSTHQLTLYVEGNKDAGSYQCVDSKSETPVKKTIHVILKSNSDALTSGLNDIRGSCFFFTVFVSIFPILNFFSVLNLI